MVGITCVEWENESLRREAARKEITNEQWMCSMSSVSRKSRMINGCVQCRQYHVLSGKMRV